MVEEQNRWNPALSGRGTDPSRTPPLGSSVRCDTEAISKSASPSNGTVVCSWFTNTSTSPSEPGIAPIPSGTPSKKKSPTSSPTLMIGRASDVDASVSVIINGSDVTNGSSAEAVGAAARAISVATGRTATRLQARARMRYLLSGGSQLSFGAADSVKRPG